MYELLLGLAKRQPFVAPGTWKKLTAPAGIKGREGGQLFAHGDYIYIYGGWETGGTYSKIVHRYNVITGVWDTAAPAPYSLRSFCSTMHKGIFYVFCGSGDNHPNVFNPTVIKYDPVADQWTTVTPSGVAIRARTEAACVSSPRGIWIIGGTVAGGITAATQLYDPDTNTLQNMADRPGGANQTGVAFTIDGKVGVSTGGTGMTAVNLLNLDTGVWSNDDPPNMPFAIGRTGYGMAYNTELIWGGLKDGSYSNEMWQYGPDKKWTSVKQGTLIPESRSGHFMGANKNKLYMFGGRTASATFFSDFWEYTPPEQTVFPDTGPGPSVLIHGNEQLGYYGRVQGSELFTAEQLSTEVNYTSGSLLPNNDVWLKFAYKGKTLFVAQQPIRNNISPTSLESANLINGSRTVTKDTFVYKVRLLLGGNTSPGNGSEWNDLMYRVHASDPTGSNWDNLTNTELVVGSGNGRSTWCQEIPSGTNRVYRGYASLTEWAIGLTGSASVTTGWRPVLELVK